MPPPSETAGAASQQRGAARDRDGSWPAILADLDLPAETEIARDGKRFLVRPAPRSPLGLRAGPGRCPATLD